MKTTYYAFFFVLSLFSAGSSAEVIRLGVTDYAANGVHQELIRDSVEEINKILEPRHSLIVKEMTESEMKTAILQHELDLFISSSAFYRQMVRSGARDIVSVETGRGTGPNRTEGAVVLVDRRRNDLISFKDLENKTVGFCKIFGNFTLHVIEREFREKGLHALTYSNKLDLQNIDLQELLEQLRLKRVDAVIAPTCSLEKLVEEVEVDTSWLKVLEPRQFSSLKCSHSTFLYPGLTVSSLPSLNSVFSKKITQGLLDILSKDGEHFWSVSTDFSEVDQLLRALDLDAWAEDRKWTFGKLIKEFWPLLLSIVLVMVCLATYGSVVSFIVRKRTKSLRCALMREQILKQKSLTESRRIEEMQRIGAFSQLSSLFAHELGQPIYAIRCFCYSLQKALDCTKKGDSSLKEMVADIENQATRAEEIVQKTRNYIKGRKGRLEKVEINHLVEKAIKTFKMLQHEDFQIYFHPTESELFVLAESLDIELILINLLRNASDACETVGIFKAWIEIRKLADIVEIRLWDSGAPISQKVLLNIKELTASSKEEGLGVGLKIVDSLVEGIGGTLNFGISKNKGLEVILRFPLSEGV